MSLKIERDAEQAFSINKPEIQNRGAKFQESALYTSTPPRALRRSTTHVCLEIYARRDRPLLWTGVKF